MCPILCSAYLPPISFFRIIGNSPEVCIEQYDNYQKQTYRNRCMILTSGGPLALTVPVVKSDTPKQLMRDVRISDHGNWRHLHWNALKSAYMNSPFFMYYEDAFKAVYDKHHTFLIDFNQELLYTIADLMNIKSEILLTDAFQPLGEGNRSWDLRWMINPDTHTDEHQTPYFQVFEEKYGFTPNLSAVDLLFNLGPESILYLRKNM